MAALKSTLAGNKGKAAPILESFSGIPYILQGERISFRRKRVVLLFIVQERPYFGYDLDFSHPNMH
jgi:hypothetical protein